MDKIWNNWELIKQIDEIWGIYKEWDKYFIRKYDWKVTWWNVETWEQWDVQYFPDENTAEKFVNSYKEIDEKNRKEVEEFEKEQEKMRG